MACEKQDPDVLQPPNRDIAEKNLTHVAWRPASMVGGHCQEHRCQVVDTTRDVLKGTYKIEEFLKSAKRKKSKLLYLAYRFKKTISKYEGYSSRLA